MAIIFVEDSALSGLILLTNIYLMYKKIFYHRIVHDAESQLQYYDDIMRETIILYVDLWIILGSYLIDAYWYYREMRQPYVLNFFNFGWVISIVAITLFLLINIPNFSIEDFELIHQILEIYFFYLGIQVIVGWILKKRL